MNIEHRTSNIECLMGKDEETEIGVECSILDFCFSFDVGRSMFDVGRSSLETTPYGINVTCECLQNTLALMPKQGLVDSGFRPAE
jgi:hypothetical protein